MSGELKGKAAVVTGGAVGMGGAIAELLAAEGAGVVVMDVDEAGARSRVESIEAAGGRAAASVGSVVSSDDAKAAVDLAVERFGGLDIVVSNAGIARLGPIESFTEAQWDDVFGVNVKGQFQMARHAIPELRKRGGGTIVNISSAQAYWSQGESFAYSASKAASVAFTRALSLDHAREGIRIVGIAPGSVRTPMLLSEARRMSPDDPDAAIASWANAHPTGRVGEPEDVAKLVLFLVGDGARLISGGTILADSGLIAGSAGW